MGQYEHQKVQILSHFVRSHVLRRVTQLLLSVSVFSLFFSHSSWLSFLHHFNFYFHTLPFGLFSHSIDKNCIFLVCNGLVVFLAKYSGLINFSSKYNLADEPYKSYEYVPAPVSVPEEESGVPLSEKEEAMESRELLENDADMETREGEQSANEEVEITEAENFAMEDQDQERECEPASNRPEEESSNASLEEEEEEEEEEGEVKESDNGVFFIEEAEDGAREEIEEEAEVGEGNVGLSTEELNKKFDDFIRRMKEELRIEARQQLIMV